MLYQEATPTGTGLIFSVAINDSGAAIIGGTDNATTTPYAAFVSPSGEVNALLGLPATNAGIISVEPIRKLFCLSKS